MQVVAEEQVRCQGGPLTHRRRLPRARHAGQGQAAARCRGSLDRRAADVALVDPAGGLEAARLRLDGRRSVPHPVIEPAPDQVKGRDGSTATSERLMI